MAAHSVQYKSLPPKNPPGRGQKNEKEDTATLHQLGQSTSWYEAMLTVKMGNLRETVEKAV